MLSLLRPSKDQKPEGGSAGADDYQPQLEQLGTQIESVQDFWRYNNNTPVDQIKMRESIYLFKSGFKPVWEDRRNINGGSWTFRVPKSTGPDFWTRIQLLAIGEKLQSVLDESELAPFQMDIRVLCLFRDTPVQLLWMRERERESVCERGDWTLTTRTLTHGRSR
jgi:hypothetical protein